MNMPDSPLWRRLYAAFFVSTCGDQLTRIVLFARVYELGGEVHGLALVALAQAIPALVAAPLAGTFSDRGRKRDLLLVSDFARCALLVLIAVTSSLPVILALAALASAFSAVFRPVEAALEPDLLPPEDLNQANAIRVGTVQILYIVGPAVAGFCLTFTTTAVLMMADAATYAVSGLILFALPRGGSFVGERADQSWRQELKAGLSYVLGNPSLRFLFAATFVLLLLMEMQGPLFYGFVAQQLGGGGEHFGALLSALGVGTLCGSWILGRVPRIHRRPLWILTGVLVVDALALLGFTYGTTVALCMVFMVFMGLISAVFLTVVRVYMQQYPPAHMRGRVFGWFEGLTGPLRILSLVLAAALADRWLAVHILRGAVAAELAVAVLSAFFLLRGLGDDADVEPTGESLGDKL